MLTTELQQDTHTGPVTLNPRWLRIPAAVKYSGLSRSRLYELISERQIKSICVKAHRQAERGVRLLDRESIDSFMLTLPTDAATARFTATSKIGGLLLSISNRCIAGRRRTPVAGILFRNVNWRVSITQHAIACGTEIWLAAQKGSTPRWKADSPRRVTSSNKK